jgi:hypothetical protein
MLKLVLACVLGAVLLLNSGCLAPYIINNNDRHNWAEINLEREKAGLRPLTWEEYHNHGFHAP